jgi:VIT1/CCC1 family predicted Fe2+/Mn2+ transporter
MESPRTAAPAASPPSAAGVETVEHLSEARLRARQMLGGESHLCAVDDWRRVLLSARDSLILIWLVWVGLHGFGDPPFTARMLVVMAVALALLVGLSTARSTYSQVRHYAAELERERAEIRDHLDEELEEVRALYAAKGFHEPLLSQIVDTLSADDDRLLKVMMEEELGLAMHHVPHPIVVGLWNFAGALLCGLMIALPASWLSADSLHYWMTIGGAVLLALISIVAGWATRRSVVEFFTVGAVIAVVTGGVVYFLAQWLAGVGVDRIPPT